MAQRHPEFGARQSSIVCLLPPAQNSARTFRRTTIATAILCACMVLFAATLLLTHSHTTAEQESGHCSICLAIHTGIPTASAPVQICLHAAPEPIVTPTPQAPEKVRVEARSGRAPPVNA